MEQGSINNGEHATVKPINGHANGVHNNGQATENQLNGQANGVHINGQVTENQLNGQATGNQLKEQAHGFIDEMFVNARVRLARVTIWSIDWGDLITDLRNNWIWKSERSWKEILLLIILFSGIVYDMVSDGLVANSFINGQNYTKSVENQNDLAVTGNECSLISHTITNFTLKNRITESFRYVYFSKVLFLFR